ncbi:hypothetical protein [Photobacterium angustum]|uniref:hypothetical protein n=1 Tax=Photobacterium angustum TaxID=661 RepID=UPI0005E580E7|nr:hypothetical protein [Photobacterium angustum]KJG18758.1 hypothetical protein UA33_01570 [Photobacterium angustum]KJG25682.1 hypothetical protein UA39_02405 [Photobacterium angustum]KJG33867.1 hypothetical protein UA36_02450 [Photobacterium angustum]PSW95009.1 hypothetical protein C0W79_13535 [Photobacterium angustum]PSX04274.1 hypothetical protein C0W87_00080 [Photobacterium angustum]
MKIKQIIILLLIFIFCLTISTDNKDAYELIEGSTSGIIGAILGGITAGISVIFGILSTMRNEIPAISKDFSAFCVFMKNLKSDVIVLVWCLVLSLLLPYFRVVGLPIFQYPAHELLPTRGQFYTAAELTTIVVSVSAIVEVISVMFNIFQMSITPKSDID